MGPTALTPKLEMQTRPRWDRQGKRRKNQKKQDENLEYRDFKKKKIFKKNTVQVVSPTHPKSQKKTKS